MNVQERLDERLSAATQCIIRNPHPGETEVLDQVNTYCLLDSHGP